MRTTPIVRPTGSHGYEAKHGRVAGKPQVAQAAGGNVKKKVVPRPGADSSQRRPP
jgi:hypothetical protein